MSDLKMLNSTKYLYKLTFIKCSYERQFLSSVIHGSVNVFFPKMKLKYLQKKTAIKNNSVTLYTVIIAIVLDIRTL